MSLGKVNVFFKCSAGAEISMSIDTNSHSDFRVVDNAAARLALKDGERKVGMLVYENDSMAYYVLHDGITDEHWQPAGLLNVKPWVIGKSSSAALLDYMPDGVADAMQSLQPQQTADGISIPPNTQGANWSETHAGVLSLSENNQGVAIELHSLNKDAAVYLMLCNGIMPMGASTANAGFFIQVDDAVNATVKLFRNVKEGDDFNHVDGNSASVTIDDLHTKPLWLAFKQVGSVYSLSVYLGQTLLASDDFDLPTAVFDRVGVYSGGGVGVVQKNEPSPLIDGVELIASEVYDTSIYPDNRGNQTFRAAGLPDSGLMSFFGMLFNGALVSFDENEQPVKQPTTLFQEDINPFLPDFNQFATRGALTEVEEKIPYVGGFATKSELAEKTAMPDAGNRPWLHRVSKVSTTTHEASPNDIVMFEAFQNKSDKLIVTLPSRDIGMPNRHDYIKYGDTVRIFVLNRDSTSALKFASLEVKSMDDPIYINKTNDYTETYIPDETHDPADHHYYTIEFVYMGHWFQTQNITFIKK